MTTALQVEVLTDISPGEVLSDTDTSEVEVDTGYLPASTLDASDPQKIAGLDIPDRFIEDSSRWSYLTARIAGFTVRESCTIASIGEDELESWRGGDEEFNLIDTSQMRRLRKDFCRTYIEQDFLRNFHLVLRMDTIILMKAALRDKGGPDLDEFEFEYLKKIRQFYTPQQLEAVKVASSETKKPGFNFTERVLTLREVRQIE